MTKEQAQQALAQQFPNQKLVFGEGEGRIILIGEAPGGEEEAAGRPFVGKAGKNLNGFLHQIGLERSALYVTNVVKFRPTRLSPKTNRPINRPPSQKEIRAFLPFLHQEIAFQQPRLVITLGNVALQAVCLPEKVVIGQFHGQMLRREGFWLFPLYHPAAVIYDRNLLSVYEADLQVLKEWLHQRKDELLYCKA